MIDSLFTARPRRSWFWPALIVLFILPQILLAQDDPAPVSDDEIVTIRVSDLTDPTQTSIDSRVANARLKAFHKKFPHIKVERATPLQIGGNTRTMDMVPLMQIASNTSPDVIYVNFRKCDTFIRQDFLLPLDRFVDKLSQEELDRRVPKPIWPVIKRAGTDGEVHVWAFPETPYIRAMLYRRDVFQEAGLPDRTPRDWNELWEWSQKLTNVKEGKHAIHFGASDDTSAWDWMSFLWSAGGEAVIQDPNGKWICAFDSREAAVAAVFYAKLIKGPWTDSEGHLQHGVALTEADYSIAARKFQLGQVAMKQEYLDFTKTTNYNPDLFGVGPVPLGPTGVRGSEFNSRMHGIYAGQKDPKIQEAAWNWIQFYTDPDGQKAVVDTLVSHGYGKMVNPILLERFGYDDYLRHVSPALKLAFESAVAGGKPEPYGKNCEQVYRMMGRPLGSVINSDVIQAALEAGDEEAAIAEAQKLLAAGVAEANISMLGVLSEESRQLRRRVALAVTIVIAVVFALTFYRISKIFSPPQDDPGIAKGKWQFGRYKFAYLLLIPALGTIALWKYYPLIRGALMAFQDYRVTSSEARWNGLDNFAEVLFDKNFHYAMWVTIKYALTFLTVGFFAPIILAILLQEVPRGKMIYRTLFYLPAVIAGLITMFLWKSFYAPGGIGNKIMNGGAEFANKIIEFCKLDQVFAFFGADQFFRFDTNHYNDWLSNPDLALLCIIVPVVWMSMGPGCLLYLAALKTVPDDLYEAANIDGAGVRRKIIHITLPSLKALIIINFIASFIAAFQASDYVLAMTGGGPYNPQGATEVVGLQIFYTAFGFLKFGTATAMAWLLGLMLIGFTVINLQRLRNMEFRTASATDKK